MIVRGDSAVWCFLSDDGLCLEGESEMRIRNIIEDAAEESKRLIRGIWVWEDEYGGYGSGPCFPASRGRSCHLLFIAAGDSVSWWQS